jgi:hypothetical protein
VSWIAITVTAQAARPIAWRSCHFRPFMTVGQFGGQRFRRESRHYSAEECGKHSFVTGIALLRCVKLETLQYVRAQIKSLFHFDSLRTLILNTAPSGIHTKQSIVTIFPTATSSHCFSTYLCCRERLYKSCDINDIRENIDTLRYGPKERESGLLLLFQSLRAIELLVAR